ncbi:MAG: His/Gly/Thr/Pro-type tRNA ligase C-terminal domain-containing protein [bacterium]
MIEHYAGAFPLWLAPEQVRILPLTDARLPYAETLCAKLREAGFRIGVDRRSEKVGAKIRDAQELKIPYMVVIGPREETSGQLAVRSRLAGDLGTKTMEDFVNLLSKETTEKGGSPFAHSPG